MNHTMIEKRAYGYATHYYMTLSGEWDQPNKHYDAFVHLSKHFEKHGKLDENVGDVWSQFANEDLDLVFAHIDDMAQAIIAQVSQALEDAKEGLVNAAINSALPDDYRHLDMKALAEQIGSLLDIQ